MKRKNFITLLVTLSVLLVVLTALISCNDSNLGVIQAAQNAQYQTPYKVLKVLGRTLDGDNTELYLATDRGFVILDNLGAFKTVGNESGNSMMNAFYAKKDGSNILYAYFDNASSTLYKKTIKLDEAENESDDDSDTDVEVGKIDGYKYIRTYSADGKKFITVFQSKTDNKQYKLFYGTFDDSSDPTTVAFISALHDMELSPTTSVKGPDGLSASPTSEKDKNNYSTIAYKFSADGSSLEEIANRKNEDVYVVGVNDNFAIYSDGTVYSNDTLLADLGTSFANSLLVPSFYNSNKSQLLIIKPEASTYFIISTENGEFTTKTRSNLASVSPETIAGVKNDNEFLLINGTTIPGSLNIDTNEYNRLSSSNPLSGFLQ